MPYRVTVFIEDPYYKNCLVADFEKEFTNLEEARKFASRFQYARIEKKYIVKFYKNKEVIKEEVVWARDLEDLQENASRLAIYYLADDRKAELA